MYFEVNRVVPKKITFDDFGKYSRFFRKVWVEKLRESISPEWAVCSLNWVLINLAIEVCTTFITINKVNANLNVVS